MTIAATFIRRLFCVLSLAPFAAFFAFAAPAPTPNVILITLDTVRADRMGFLGSKLGLTPNLDAFARQSSVFSHAYSQVPLTAPSHATILTGTYPQFNQVNDFQVPLSSDLPYAPEIFRAHGYRTAAFIGAIILDPAAKFAPGFDRGFETYDAGFTARHSGEDRYSTTERRGADVATHALAWLTAHPKSPFFIWVHLYDAHHPYDPPEPYKTRYAHALYNGEVAYVDSTVGKFLRQLRSRGLYDNAIIAVMADHGEALGEHGEETHGIFLYDETIHVPLLIKRPGAITSTKQIQQRVGLVDVLPTILDAAGLPVPQTVQGQSLFPMMNGKDAPADRPAYAESDYPHRAYGWSPLRALRTGKYLYIDAPRRELYDQIVDPKSARDLSGSSTAVTTTLAGQLETFRRNTSSAEKAPPAVLDPEAQQKLAGLGYMASGANGSSAAAKDAGADPKDEIQIANLTNQANFFMEDNRCHEAIPVWQQLIPKEPDASLPLIQLGKCLIMTRDFEKAVPILRGIVESHPDLAISRFQLASSLLATDDVPGAATQLEIVVTKIPNWERAHLMLATAYMQMNRPSDAIKQCEAVLQFDPNHPQTNLLLGRILLDSGDAEGALPRFNKASQVQPDSPAPHMLLADAYEKLGRKADADRERAEAKRLGGSDDQ
jgi:choline-sulfatase